MNLKYWCDWHYLVKDVSQPYIGTTKGAAINSDVYVRECLPKLLAFIKTHHQHDEYIFWADLANFHYDNTTIDWLNERKINFVTRSVNPPNVSKARPILAQKVYGGGWKATTQQQLKKSDLNVIQKKMLGVRNKSRKIEDRELFLFCN